MDSFFHRALPYIEMGWKVFPSTPDKVPLCPNGRKDATCVSLQIEDWSEMFPQANVSIKTGADSGIVVIDIDDEEGERFIEAINRSWTRLPETAEAKSGRGRHLYFRYPRVEPIGCSAGKLHPGIDIRGDGGSITAPVSLHPSGKLYEWVKPPFGRTLPTIPMWIVRAVAPKIRTTPLRSYPQDTSPERIAHLLDQIKNAPAGQRNHTLNKVSFLIGMIVRDGGLNEREALDFLVASGMAAGLPKFEAIATAKSGLRSGMRHATYTPTKSP